MGTLSYILQFFCTDSHWRMLLRHTLLHWTLLQISSTAHTATADCSKQLLHWTVLTFRNQTMIKMWLDSAIHPWSSISCAVLTSLQSCPIAEHQWTVRGTSMITEQRLLNTTVNTRKKSPNVGKDGGEMSTCSSTTHLNTHNFSINLYSAQAALCLHF
jgi:hypothetical protein